MYDLFSGKRNITLPTDNLNSKTVALEVARQIVTGKNSEGRLSSSSAKPPRSVIIRGIKGAAKNATPIEVVAIGRTRIGVDIRKAA